MALFVGAVLCGAPLFTIIGGASILLFHFIAHGSVLVIIVEMSRLADAPGFIAIPLFIFAGFVFAETNSPARLIRVSNALLGWLSGGLAVVTVIVCTIFTALTGGSGITIVACGGILLPALLKAGYDADFSLGFVTSAASSGVLFIPSLLRSWNILALNSDGIIYLTISTPCSVFFKSDRIVLFSSSFGSG